MRKMQLVRTIPSPIFNKALFSISPALSGFGTAHYVIVEVSQNGANYKITGCPCNKWGNLINPNWKFQQFFLSNTQDDFLEALYNLIIAIKMSDQQKQMEA